MTEQQPSCDQRHKTKPEPTTSSTGYLGLSAAQINAIPVPVITSGFVPGVRALGEATSSTQTGTASAGLEHQGCPPGDKNALAFSQKVPGPGYYAPGKQGPVDGSGYSKTGKLLPVHGSGNMIPMGQLPDHLLPGYCGDIPMSWTPKRLEMSSCQ